MRRPAALTLANCGALLILALCGRLMWVAWGSETGHSLVQRHWRDATLGFVVGDYVPIPARDPSEQAEFWLGEVDRVLTADPDDPELRMGAAWVLDSPGYDFAGKHVKLLESAPGLRFPSFDQASLRRAEDAFEAQCAKRSLALAAQAVELDPSRPAWRQAHALLLWHDLLASVEVLRDADWREILAQGARHDPDNALYDYLAARAAWNASAEIDFAGTNPQLIITDVERFQEGVRLFQQGQRKPYFAAGDEGFAATAEFLRHAKISPMECASIANGRRILLRRSTLLLELWRWQQSRAEDMSAAGDARGAWAALRQNSRLIEQFTQGSPSAIYDPIALRFGVESAVAEQRWVDAHPDLLTAEERAEVTARERKARLQQLVMQVAARGFAPSKPPPKGSPTEELLAFTAQMLPSLITPLLMLVLIAGYVQRFGTVHDHSTVGPVAQSAALLGALATTVVVLGLAPAEILPRKVQAWAFSLLLLVAPVVLIAGFGGIRLHRRGFRFGLRSLLLAIFVIGLILGLAVLVLPSIVAHLPFEIFIPPRGVDGWDVAVIKNALTSPNDWRWVVFQWSAYHGQYVTLALWLGALMAWQWGRERTSRRAEQEGPPRRRDRIARLARMLGRSSAALAAPTLVAYLLVTPLVLRKAEQDYQQSIVFARHPSQHWTQVEQAVQQVRADLARMCQLRKAVQGEMTPPPFPDEQP